MAEEKAKEGEAKVETVSPGGGGQKPILFIALAVVNMLIVAGVGAMIYLGKKKEAQKPTLDQVIQGEHESQKKESETEEEYIGKLIPMETFVINLAGSRGGKLAKINMELEVSNAELIDEIDKRKPQIRDIVIILLSSKSYEQVSTKDGKDSLRDEIRDTINSFLIKGKIKRVYFTEFIFS